MCRAVTRVIKVVSLSIILGAAIGALPYGWLKVVALASFLAWYFYGEQLRAAIPKSNISEAPSSAHRASDHPIMLYIEGPPASGKTFLLEQQSTRSLGNQFGCDVEIIPEEIDSDALADFNDSKKKPIVGYTFELYMLAIRERDDNKCRANPSRLHVFDRTLIGSHVFHIANYVVGTYDATRARRLFAMNLVERACAPITLSARKVTQFVPEIVIVYCPTDFQLCHTRIVDRDGADKHIDKRYHEIVVFVYAYVMLMIEARYPHVGFLPDDVFIQSGGAKQTAKRLTLDYDAGRQAVRRLARANIDINMTDVERARFTESVGNYKPNGLVWSKLGARWHCEMMDDK